MIKLEVRRFRTVSEIEYKLQTSMGWLTQNNSQIAFETVSGTLEMVHKVVYAALEDNYDNLKGGAAQTLVCHIHFVNSAS